MRKPIVALYGGSFDPPHLGHQSIVKRVTEVLEIDKLIIIPAYLNPFKKESLAPPSLRLEWCQTLFKEIPNVEVNDYEIKQNRAVRSYETIQHLNQTNTVAYFIIGADNLSSIKKWYQFEWLNQHIKWIIITREGYTLERSMLKKSKILTLTLPISSTHIRQMQDLKHIDRKIQSSVKEILKGKQTMSINQRIEKIISLLDEKKAQQIEVFNLDKADYIAQKVIIANSLNGKHTLALFDYLKKELKESKEEFLASDISDDWVVGDLGDILIHIMIPQYRQRYAIETFLSELIAKQNESKEY